MASQELSARLGQPKKQAITQHEAARELATRGPEDAA